MLSLDLLWDFVTFEWARELFATLSLWCDQARTWGTSAYDLLKRKAFHILKTAGVLITIAFAGASLYYAKAAADDARCQFELQKRQYCESQPEEVKRRFPCAEILRHAISIDLSCLLPGYLQELVFTILGIRIQVYSRCGDFLYDGMPWWHQWGGMYSSERFRPILWRFPVVYTVALFLREEVEPADFVVGASVILIVAGKRRMRWLISYLSLSVLTLSFSWWLLAAELARQHRWLLAVELGRQHRYQYLKLGSADEVTADVLQYWNPRAYEPWFVRILMRFQASEYWKPIERLVPSLTPRLY
ncbi:hypothetical protein DL768_006339 [Monosporascus sp. mg162]|nr:hypothetical protein DL768_006339 [Monosporascus sp. mg162]